MKKFLSVIFALTAVIFTAQARDFRLLSPSGDIKLTVSVSSGIFWSVEYKGEKLLEDNQISLTLSDGTVLGEGYLRPRAYRHSEENVLTDLVPTKNRLVTDRFNEMLLRFSRDWAVVFRAYDNGVAYRFETEFDGDIEVKDERSQWNFCDDAQVYWVGEKNPGYITHCEANFQQMPLSQVDDSTYSYLPLSFKTSEGTRMVITEADLFDYPNLFLRSGGRTSLAAEFPRVIDRYEMRTDRDVTVTELADVIARTEGTRSFPWRVLTIGTDRELIENTLPWQLSSKEVPGDYLWLRPGKISWEWWAALNVYGVDFEAGVNTDTYKYYIDFAAKYGLPYILMDEGWSKSTLNIVEPKDGLDLQELISYGASKGVGVVLWALWTPFATEGVEKILDVYQKWGVAGIKVDFMQMQDQNMVNLYEKIAAESCRRHILVDYHGAFKPAGLQRKYPNAMTFEGVYGMEHDKCSYDISPDHDLKLPFTRMVAGPMDYTPGAVNNATRDDFAIRWNHPMSQGTRSHQAAIFVVFESPLTMLCDSPSNYYKVPDYTEFISAIPTVWEKTVCQEAEAGEYVLASRQTLDGRWYSAALNNWTARTLSLDTSFLGEGQWNVTIHRDGVNANVWAEDYVIEKKTVTAGDVIDITLANGGGWVAEFTR
jgi:alpha-glucosidase